MMTAKHAPIPRAWRVISRDELAKGTLEGDDFSSNLYPTSRARQSFRLLIPRNRACNQIVMSRSDASGKIRSLQACNDQPLTLPLVQ
jgi:hypothetical protein